jgi:hypothetical protein
MYFSVSAFAADTLNTNRHNVYLGIRYGLPVINQLTIYSSITHKGYYNVISAPKSCYEFFIIDNYKKFNYSLGISLLQSEFKGEDFKIYSYYLYQKVNYNIYYASLGFGRNFKLGTKHTLSPSIYLYFPVVYDLKIDNIYSENNVNDTTLYSATKNGFNYDTNFGHFPRLKISANYNYSISKRFRLSIDLSLLYARTFGGKTPDPYRPSTAINNTNNYSFMAYEVGQQIVLLPTIGITYKLN